MFVNIAKYAEDAEPEQKFTLETSSPPTQHADTSLKYCLNNDAYNNPRYTLSFRGVNDNSAVIIDFIKGGSCLDVRYNLLSIDGYEFNVVFLYESAEVSSLN